MRGIPLRYSIRNLRRRPARTLLTVLGLSLVVGLIVFLVAFGRSFVRAVRIPGSPRHLIVVSKKAQTFEFSSIPASELDLMEQDVAEEVETLGNGDPVFSREVYHLVHVRLDRDPSARPRRGLLLGIEPELVPALVPGFELLEGRLPDPDAREALVGRAVAAKLEAPQSWLGLGARVSFRDASFEVVGRFRAPGTLYESWILLPPGPLRVPLGRRDYSFARMRLRPGVDADRLAARLSLDERYQVRALREDVYFADFSEGFSTLQSYVALLALVLAVGGLLTGMNTMHNAVVGRIREIGVLRVLGFGKRKVFLAFLVEALLLAGAAGLLGCAAGYAVSGLPLRVPFAAFALEVDGPALLVGFATALLMGALGLVLPLLRALRLPPGEAVRAV